MTGKELAERAYKVATDYKTLYVMGCFGAPMTTSNKERYIAHHPYNQQPERAEMIRAASASTFGFDCVNLIKALLWGWSGDKTRVYGGAKYNGGYVGDIDADGLIAASHRTNQNWNAIQPGCVVWLPGHVGLYVGKGLVVESTPNWKNGVQITALANIPAYKSATTHSRVWSYWGKIPGVSYEEEVELPTDNELPEIDDVVYFAGGKHYAASTSKIGFTASPGYAKVFNVAPTAPHPVALIHTDRTSNVYGWVDKNTIKRSNKS